MPRMGDDDPVMTRFPTELRRLAGRMTLAELRLEAVLPADECTAEVLRRRWG